ncbi:MAG: restriction endonuclease subunit S [Algibacter sp.]|uniref:restriction endonuclease subunit S n=1 Tax=Algibacter sp. TaxID=1872428 RepID=UPI00329A403B
MKTYEKYKDSGIKWIGDIPEHWESKRIRHLADIFGRIGYRGYKVTDLVQKGEGAITISPSNMKDFHMDFSNCTYLSWDKYNESPEIMIQDGDILFVKTGSTYGKSSFVKDLPEKSTINPQIIVLKNIECDNKLLWYIIKSENIQYQVEQTVVGGTIPTISQARINNYSFPLPPTKEEQTELANYLDKKTTEIDQLIADKEQLVTLYREEKTAIIDQAVTKGINQNVKLKDSGIEWLGDIPEHWDAVSLKWVSNIYSGGTPSKNKPEYWTNGTIPWLNSGTVNQWDITEPSEYITEEALNNSSAKWIPEKAILMALAGQGKTKGMVAQVQFKCTCNQSMGIIIPNNKIDNRFLLYWLKRNYQNIRNLGGGDKRDGINLEMIGGIPLPFFKVSEQTEIVQHIERESAKINAKIDKAEKYIKLLTEYRTALISEVVTGKIKVID